MKCLFPGLGSAMLSLTDLSPEHILQVKKVSFSGQIFGDVLVGFWLAQRSLELESGRI